MHKICHNVILASFLIGCSGAPAVLVAETKIKLSKKEVGAIKQLLSSTQRLQSIPIDFNKKMHKGAFSALTRMALGSSHKKHFTKTLNTYDAIHKKTGMADPGLVYLSKGKKYNYLGEASQEEVGPVQAITSFENVDGNAQQFGASALVSLPNPDSNQVITCTHTLQIYDDQGNPQGNADVVTQQLACENVQLYAEGTLDAEDQYANAVLTTTWTNANGPQTPMAMHASGSRIPTSIVSTDPNDKNGDDMIKFCFGRRASDCDYMPSGGSKNNVYLPITGNTTFSAALVDPATDPDASVSISMTQPNPTDGGGCNLVGNVADFMNTVTLTNSDMTVNWNDTSVSFPAIDSTCMPNGSIVYYNMSMNVDLAGTPTVPTFFGISSSPDTPVSTGYYLQLAQTRVYYSCLAGDTLVTLADGSRQAIETLTKGEHMVKDGDGKLMKIKSVYQGEEDEIIELVTSNDTVIRVTDGHPVITPNGPQLARFLKQGDKVVTDMGVAKLTQVSRKAYGGKVYNLSLLPLDTDTFSSVASTGSSFYGNGLLVGDNEMQWLYDRVDAGKIASTKSPIKATISENAKILIERRTGQVLDLNRYVVQ